MPLFGGIISDLFPGVECPKPDYGVFMEALKDNIKKRQLQAVPWFLDKIIQVKRCRKFDGQHRCMNAEGFYLHLYSIALRTLLSHLGMVVIFNICNFCFYFH